MKKIIFVTLFNLVVFSVNALSIDKLNENKTFPRRVIVEEGTGTWCSSCPSGIVAMKMMKEKYPDTFIGIAVHNRDEMTVAQYDAAMVNLFFQYFPSCIVNRKSDKIGEPYPLVEGFYLEEMEIPCHVGISISAEFDEEDSSKINVKSVTTFGFSSESANYRLAYVLLENEVTDPDYKQANQYAGKAEEMGGFENLPREADIEFNDVARGIYSFNGIIGSIPEVVEENVPIEHTYEITLPNTIKDKSKLEVVVMLLDVESGEIINADKIEVEAPDDTSIDSLVENGLKVTLSMEYFNQLVLFLESEENVNIKLYNLEGILLDDFVTHVDGVETVTIPINQNRPYIIKVSNSRSTIVRKI